MNSFHIPEDDYQVIVSAFRDISRGGNSSAWNPYHLPEPRLTVWAVVVGQEMMENLGFKYFWADFYQTDWPDKSRPYSVFWEAFHRIGAVEAAECIEKAANLLFSKDSEMLREAILSGPWDAPSGSDEFDRLYKGVMSRAHKNYLLLSQYILRQVEFFPTVSRKREG